VPMAMPAPARNPNLMSRERICRCFGGAIATPAGLEAAPPLTSTGGATAVPLGCCGVRPCGVCAGGAFCCVAVEPGFSGSSGGGCIVLGEAGTCCAGAVGSGVVCCASRGSTVQLTKTKKLPATLEMTLFIEFLDGSELRGNWLRY